MPTAKMPTTTKVNLQPMLHETGRAGFVVQTETHDFIADVMQMNCDGPANARLIAAAPDLLAACQAAFEQINDYLLPADSDYLDFARTRDQLRAAISKAGGQNG